LLLILFKLVLLLLDGFLSLIEFLEVVDLHLDISAIDINDFLIQVLYLLLKVLDLLIHLLDVLFPLSKILPPLMLLFFQILLQEAKITSPLIVDLLATAFPAN